MITETKITQLIPLKAHDYNLEGGLLDIFNNSIEAEVIHRGLLIMELTGEEVSSYDLAQEIFFCIKEDEVLRKNLRGRIGFLESKMIGPDEEKNFYRYYSVQLYRILEPKI